MGSPVDLTESSVDLTGSPVDLTGSPDEPTGSPVDLTGSPVDLTGSPVDLTERVVGGTDKALDVKKKDAGSKEEVVESKKRAFVPTSYTAAMTLDEVIAAMYASFSFERGERPDRQRQSEIFAPGARLVRVNDDGVFEFDLASFQRNLEEMIDSGTLVSFWEGELWRETRQFSDIAHVLSGYETRTTRGGEVLYRAVKSIQAFQRNNRWWISAMLWRREGKDLQIDTR